MIARACSLLSKEGSSLNKKCQENVGTKSASMPCLASYDRYGFHGLLDSMIRVVHDVPKTAAYIAGFSSTESKERHAIVFCICRQKGSALLEMRPGT